MRCEPVTLRFMRGREDRPLAIRLREPRGRDELGVEGIDTRSALELIDRLAEGDGAAAAGLCAADRDALLAALYRLLWGDRVLSTLTCEGCGSPFDLSFDLSALQHQLYAGVTEWPVTGERRVTAADGRTRLLPSGAEELSVAALRLEAGLAELAALCGGDPAGIESLSADLEAAAPILDLDLDAACPECGHAQLARFDLQSFLLQRLLGERGLLLREVHALAAVYGWSLEEILGLPRSTRRAFAQLIDEARRPAAGGWG